MARRGGIFYGWMIVSASFLTLLLVCGLWSTFSIFINPLQAEFNRDRASVSVAMSMGLVVYGVSLPFIGRLIDRFGPKKVILLSSILAGVSTVLLGLVSRLWQYLLLYGVPLAIGYAGAGLVANTSLVRRWFTERSELALSLTQSGLPLGQLVVVPLAAHLTVGWGWRSAYIIMGLVMLATIPTTVFFVVGDRAREEGAGAEPVGGVEERRLRERLEAGLGEHIRRPPFLILAVVYFLCGFTDIPIATHMAPFIVDRGLTEMAAAYVLSIIGGATWLGTLLFGFLSRKFRRRFLLVAIYLIRAATFPLLLGRPRMPHLILFAIFFGVTQFSMVPLISSWIGDMYGHMYLGRLFGVITLIHALGASSGTYLDGWVFDVTRSYRSAFILSSALALAASVLIYFIGEKRRRHPM